MKETKVFMVACPAYGQLCWLAGSQPQRSFLQASRWATREEAEAVALTCGLSRNNVVKETEFVPERVGHGF
jgi:hypothetical protein